MFHFIIYHSDLFCAMAKSKSNTTARVDVVVKSVRDGILSELEVFLWFIFILFYASAPIY